MLSDYYQTEVRRQRAPAIYWRDTSARYYDLFRPLESPRTYVDGGNMIDYPHFRSISLGVGAEFNLLVDINGQFHLSVSGGEGATLGLGYTEGYLCNFEYCENNIEMPQLSEITKAINGICGEGSSQLGAGIAVSLCPSAGDPLTLTGIAAYYLGAEVGYGAGGSVTVSLPYRNLLLGWADAVNDQLNGWDLTSAYYYPLFH